MRNGLIAVVLILLIAVSPCAQTAYADSTANGAAHQGNIDDKHVNEKVYQGIKAAAEARRDELLYLLEVELPSDIMEKLEEALYTMKAAEETEDPRSATEHYLHALKQLRKTWQEYLNNKPDAVKESFEEIDASDKPKAEETTPPENIYEEINTAKEKRLTEIQQEVKEKIVKVSEHVDELKDYLSEEDSNVVKKAIENEKKKLEEIMEKVEKGEYDAAIDELIETEFEIEDDVDKMSDKEAAETLKTVEKIQFQVLKTEEQKKKKAEEGEDTSEEDKTIDEFSKEIHEIKYKFKQKSLLKIERFRKLDKKERSDDDEQDKIIDMTPEEEEPVEEEPEEEEPVEEEPKEQKPVEENN